jgi:hypothetical protein
MKKIPLIIALCTASSLYAQQNVEQINTTDNAQNSVVYYLPKTSLKIEVEVKKTIQKAGPYAKDAKKRFDFEDGEAIMADNVTYEISSIKISSKGVPNFFQLYKVTAPLKSKANLVQLNESGIIQGVNVPYDELPAQTKEEAVFVNEEANTPVIVFDKSDLPEEYFSAATTEEQINIAADQIHKYRETGYDMLSGFTDNIPSDAATFQLMLDELKRKENNILALFKGKSITVTEHKTFELVPEKSNSNKPLFYFSASAGFVAEGTTNAETYYITFLPPKNDVISEPVTEKPGTKKGFFYCIPQNVSVRVYNKDKILYEENIPMAQFGSVSSLPPNFIEKNNTSIIFDTTTGVIQMVQK